MVYQVCEAIETVQPQNAGVRSRPHLPAQVRLRGARKRLICGLFDALKNATAGIVMMRWGRTAGLAPRWFILTTCAAVRPGNRSSAMLAPRLGGVLAMAQCTPWTGAIFSWRYNLTR
jgi:hypothetical protein